METLPDEKELYALGVLYEKVDRQMGCPKSSFQTYLKKVKSPIRRLKGYRTRIRISSK